MKKPVFCLILLLSLVLTGCYQMPQTAADGSPWQTDWVMVSPNIGVEPQENGLTLMENSEALAGVGMYYTTWSLGEGHPYTNADGEDATLYDACLYFLASEHDSPEAAALAVADWQTLAETNYLVEETGNIVGNGQEFSLLMYTCDPNTSPYHRGVSAYGVYGSWAIAAELTCIEDYEGNLQQLLQQFLDSCHYRPVEEE